MGTERCATPPKGKSKGKGRDDTKGKGKGFKGGGKGQGGGHPSGHCGKTGHGPANCWTLHPDQIPWKRSADVEEETPVGGLGFDIGCIEIAAPPGLGRTPVKIRNRFQVLEEPLEMSIGGLESEVYVETANQNREKLKPAGKGRITIDSGAAESVLPVGMLPGEETSDCLDMVGGLPWKPNPSDDLGGEVMPAIDMPMAEPEVEIRRPEYCEGEIVPRRLYLRTRDFKEHGATRGCKVCIAMARGSKGVPHTEACRKRMTEAIAETDEGRERAKATIKEFRAGGREVEFEEPVAKRARGSDESMKAEVPDSCAGAAQEHMEDDAEDRMEKQKRASGWEDLAKRTKRPRKDDDDEDMLLEVACQDGFDEAGWAEEFVDGQEDAEEFNDDRSGKKLDPKKVRQARDEELVELERRVYVEADVEECVKVTGKKPIQVRWVDVDKGFGVYRSRLVAKDFKPKNKIDDREGLYAATPPLEVVKFLIMQAATKCRQGMVRKVMLIYISKAHLYAPNEGEQYVDLAPERAKAGKCAKLLYTLYGLRTAASSWVREYSQTLEVEGFVPGIASKCTFFHPDTEMTL